MDEVIEGEMLAILPRLRRFALGLTGSIAEGDDLVQATCERAIRNLDKWRPGTRLDSWMFRIAHNLHRNAIRDRQTRTRHLRVLESDQPRSVDGEAGAEARLTLERVRQHVLRLPDDQRTVLLLVAVEGRSYAETSDILGVPVGTVTSRLARAREQLRADLASRSQARREQVAEHVG